MHRQEEKDKIALTREKIPSKTPCQKMPTLLRTSIQLVILVFLSLPVTVYAIPEVASLTPAAGSTVSALTRIEITFSEPVSGVDANDLLVNAVAPISVSGSEEGPYVFTFTQPPSGSVSVSFDFDHGISAIDGAGAFAPVNGWSYELIDTLAPEIGEILASDHSQPAISPAPFAAVTALTEVQITFSEPVTGVDAADLLINGTAASTIAGSDVGPYVFTFSQPPVGAIAFTWAATTDIKDLAGNSFVGSESGWNINLVAGSHSPLQITEFSAANATGPEDDDSDTPDWVEIYNPGPQSVNLLGWSLSKDPLGQSVWQFPSLELAADSFLLVFCSGKDRKSDTSELHTNFSLDLRGGYLALFGPESPRPVVYEYVDYPEQPYDVSYGLTTTGQLRFFASPTASEPNPADGLINVSPSPTFSVSRGFFAEPFSLVVSTSDPTATIRYTLNGSEPTEESTAYSAPLSIDKTTILRAATFAASSIRSRTVTHSYIYLDQVLNQPEPPYDNPERDNDDDNPPLPVVGDYTFPIEWGTQSGAGFPGLIRNLPSNRAPADYGMDREIIDDPAKYNDDGDVDEVNGITNLERIKKSFRELPLMSVVLDNDLMFSTRGLHWNSTVKGTRYEAPCSVELLLPDGTTEFDTTCGIRLHGNASREPRKCPKHGFKLNFKGEFGASNLKAPLFPDTPATEFDDIILRGDFNSSWLHWDGGTQRPRATRLRDAYSKDTFRDMGRAAGHHRYVHLFINGIYWGTYDATEQENSGFAANTFGGEREDYDVYEQGGRKSGSSTVYNAMRRIRQPIDNSEYELMKTMLDVPWLADYMILHFYLGHQDWGGDVNKNWYAVRHKDGTFRYLPWDMENLMWSENHNSTTVSSPPTGLHTNLDSNDQYLLDFADRAHKHMVAPDGALLPDAMATRWRKWRAVMQNAIAAESARWGDYRRDVHRHQSGPYVLFTWNESWIAENNRLLSEYFPVRTENVLAQMRRRNLYPELNAPEFHNASNEAVGSQRVEPGFQITMELPDPAPTRSRSAGTIYYTVDGSDPRVYFDTTGRRNPSAMEYSGGPITITQATTVKARALDGTDWSALMEATFTMGSELPQIRFSEIHYNPPGSQGGSALEFVELINTGNTSVDLGKWSFEGIEFIFPWGTILGPNARLVVANNEAPNTFSARYPNVALTGYFKGSLSNAGERLTLLDGKKNHVASVEYDDEYPWPQGADDGGASLENINPDGDPQNPGNWRASSGNGSPGLPNSAAPSAVTISEFRVGDSGFVELYNSTGTSISAAGWIVQTDRANNSVTLPAGTSIPAGGYLSINAGSASPGALPEALRSDAGEILVGTASSELVDSIRYGPQATGYSFGKISGAWMLTNSSPGAVNTAASTAPQTALRLNEWLADPDPGFDDWLEVYNTDAAMPIVLTGLQVGVSGEFYSITALAAVAPSQAVQLLADRGSQQGDRLLLKLPARGATLTLKNANSDPVDSLTYGSQTVGATEGRLPDGTGDIVSLPFASPGAPNHLPAATDPALSEVLAVNINGDNAPWARRPAWVEIANPSATATDLSNWKLRTIGNGTNTFTFPAGSTLSAAGYLRVWCDPAEQPSSSATGALNSALPIDSDYSDWGVELVNPNGQVIDRITWGWQIADQSVGRIADGSWALLSFPTPGAANSDAQSIGDVTGAKINEWFADSSGSAVTRSFIEFYNITDQPIALGGLWLSDEPSEVGRRKWQIPELTYIGGNQHVVFESDSGTSRPNRFLFDLNAGGESIRLGQNDANTTAVESLTYGMGAAQQSLGSLPDGSAAVGPLNPTPGHSNTSAPGPAITRHPQSTAVPAGQPFELAVKSPNALSFQWMRNGTAIAGATESDLTIASASRSHDGSYSCVATNADGSTTSRTAAVSILYTYATWAAEFGVGAANEDPDADGFTNYAEFLGGTSPNNAATPAERASATLGAGFERSGSQDFLTIDMTLDRRAVFSQINGETSATLQAPWSPTTPINSEVIATTPDGHERVRFRFPTAEGAAEQYLRIRLEP